MPTATSSTSANATARSSVATRSSSRRRPRRRSTPRSASGIGAIAVDAARAVGYRSAGTIEGLLDRDGAYYFMEMNTRIQVEHTVTELVTGLDLVREQVLIAAGEPLSLRQEDVRLTGHAIECRINAEDPSAGFRPSPGRITGYREPGGPGVRVDSGVEDGSEISPLYDPMIAKLIVHGVDREHARNRMLRALDEFEIGGVTTLLGFHRALLRHPCFVDGGTCHGVVESEQLAQQAEQLSHVATKVTTAPDGRLRERVTAVELDGRRYDVKVLVPEPPWAELAERRRERTAAHAGGAGGRDAIVSPMQGTVLSVHVADGDAVAAGQVICIVEAMKMENEVHAPHDGDRLRAVGAGGRAGRRGPGDLRRRARARLGAGCRNVDRSSARRSRCENAEPLAATASRVDHWILVEYRGLWGHDAVAASGLSDEVKARLRAQRDARPNTKLLFVRRPHRRGHPALAVFWGSSPERGGTLSTPSSTATTTCSSST